MNENFFYFHFFNVEAMLNLRTSNKFKQLLLNWYSILM